jgi:hypothetical protein
MKTCPRPALWSFCLAALTLALSMGLAFSACDSRGTNETGLPASDAGTNRGAGGAGGAQPTTLEGKCRTLLQALCAKYAACDSTLTQQECLAGLKTDCSKVVDIGPSYDQCLRDLPNVMCPLGKDNFPASCDQILTTSQ